ncbi:unnamed protein product [Medioppia subpectinata]|uniref:Ig-like domain-containing protein n=1 Tax=Medioppia subpectinata TaxID=1979941 RepID=A0A7R9Q647_9ACAR|nr:unnamed protein product [Medioppia subpectinata]CAG2114028.1 unnamed protein product [Medioppia subpectinata]
MIPEPTVHRNPVLGVHLDEEKSSETGDVLYLYDIDLTSEGYYKCEVSADYSFQTIRMESYMTIIVPPTKPPLIEGHKTFYSIGEVVTSYCIPSYSKPKPSIKWYINGEESPEYYIIAANITDEFTSGINFTLEEISSEETIINGTNELESVPLISGLKSKYTLGEYLYVNCSIPHMIYETSQPRLQWFIHNQKVCDSGFNFII